MENYRFDDARVLLIDPHRSSRDSLYAVLHSHGFKNIVLGSSFADVAKPMENATPDLIIADAELDGGDFCGLVKSIRHSEVGTDPFIPVVSMTWKATPKVVRGVVDSGADMLVSKPISTGRVMNTIKWLIDSRKPFVVTSDYIGPDRHRTPTRKTTVPVFDAPNVLKAKATGRPDPDTFRRSVAEMLVTVNQRKLEQHAERITALVEFLMINAADGQNDEKFVLALERLVAVAEDMAHRLVGTPHDHISELCQSMIKITRQLITFGADFDDRNIRLLVPLSRAIKAAFDNSDKSALVAREISKTLATRKIVDDSELRRRKFLLRLVVTKICPLFRGADPVITEPRAFVRGLDDFLTHALGVATYIDLNRRAKEILESFGGKADSEIWDQVLADKELKAFALGTLMRLLFRFEDFESGKQRFFAIVNGKLPSGDAQRYDLTHQQFNAIFGTLFADLFDYCEDFDGARHMTEVFGSDMLRRVRKMYAKFLASTEPPAGVAAQ